MYFILPKTSSGFVTQINELASQEKSFKMTNFKTAGDLFYIRKRIAQTTSFMVIGIFADDIDIFFKDQHVSEYSFTRVNEPFGIIVPQKLMDKYNLYDKYNLKKINNLDHYFVDDKDQIINELYYIAGTLNSGWYQIYIEPINHNFVLYFYKR